MYRNQFVCNEHQEGYHPLRRKAFEWCVNGADEVPLIFRTIPWTQERLWARFTCERYATRLDKHERGMRVKRERKNGREHSARPCCKMAARASAWRALNIPRRRADNARVPIWHRTRQMATDEQCESARVLTNDKEVKVAPYLALSRTRGRERKHAGLCCFSRPCWRRRGSPFWNWRGNFCYLQSFGSIRRWIAISG